MPIEDTKVLVKQGAEGRLFNVHYLNKPAIVKERFKKKYRNDILDDNILKERTKAEARGLLRCKIAGVCSPAVYKVDIESRSLYMEYIEGDTVKNYIDKILASSSLESNPKLIELTEKIGSAVGKIHINNLIHGDLTTSNMIIENSSSNLYLIDFGLSFVSSSAEDKGVDLYVLERAITSTHACSNDLFDFIIRSYSKTNKASGKEVLRKYEEVKARGRKRTMVG